MFESAQAGLVPVEAGSWASAAESGLQVCFLFPLQY